MAITARRAASSHLLDVQRRELHQQETSRDSRASQFTGYRHLGFFQSLGLPTALAVDALLRLHRHGPGHRHRMSAEWDCVFREVCANGDNRVKLSNYAV